MRERKRTEDVDSYEINLVLNFRSLEFHVSMPQWFSQEVIVKNMIDSEKFFHIVLVVEF